MGCMYTVSCIWVVCRLYVGCISFFAGILFYPAFCVFRTWNAYVLVLVCRRLSVGLANCSSSLLCFQNEEWATHSSF